MSNLPANLTADLERLRREHLYRRRRVLSGPQGPRPTVDGRDLLAFCSNDYLGLASHPEVVAALQAGAAKYGAGSGAAHLISGHSAAHQALEDELADFTGRARALLFSTGYMANLGVISALARRGKQVLEDRSNHASLIDGAILSGARLRRYPHADAAALSRMLISKKGSDPFSWQQHRHAIPLSEKSDLTPFLIATDGVFSMDGDIAPLRDLAEVAEAAGALLVVDDAHGLGVVGEEGRGTLELADLSPARVPILVGTLGKAFGTFGAFVAGDEDLIETLIQRARSYIYTTALPPAVAEATRASVRLVRREHWRREHLRALIARFRRGAEQLDLPLAPSETPIQPLVVGDNRRALAWSQALEAAGILVTAIRPPTVPQGSARLRVTLSAAHSEADVDTLLAALAVLPFLDESARCLPT
jgi:8-amino-7-oxononanoate synthase